MACGAVSARRNLVSSANEGTSALGELPNRGGRSKARHKEQGARDQKKSKDHRLPSEFDDDVILRLAGSRRPELDVFKQRSPIHTVWAGR